LSLQPVFNSKSSLSQILALKDGVKDDQVLIDLVGQIDPGQVRHVLDLVEVLRSSSQADLDRIKDARKDAETALIKAADAHNAAHVAKFKGDEKAKLDLEKGQADSLSKHDKNVAALTKTHDAILLQLDTAVNTTKSIMDDTEVIKINAKNIFNQENGRLKTEISNFVQVLEILRGVIN
jgi:hypothetical protein